MQQIKFLPNNKVRLGDKVYKGYTISNLPKKFAFIYDENEDREGINNWFNYKGLTYIEIKESIWSQINKDNEQMNVDLLFKCMN